MTDLAVPGAPPPAVAPRRAERVAAVLFDIDDTLYDVGDLVMRQWRASADALAALGLDVEPLCAAYQRVRPGLACRAALGATLAALGRPDLDPDLLHQISNAGVPPVLPLRPGAAPLLAALASAGVRLGAVTNGCTPRQRAKVAALGLTGLLEVVVCAGDEGVPAKPSPVPFRLALAALGVAPERALMVGDRPDLDVAPALALGMAAVRLVAGHYAALPAHPGAALESADPVAVWAHVAAVALPG